MMMALQLTRYSTKLVVESKWVEIASYCWIVTESAAVLQCCGGGGGAQRTHLRDKRDEKKETSKSNEVGGQPLLAFLASARYCIQYTTVVQG